MSLLTNKFDLFISEYREKLKGIFSEYTSQSRGVANEDFESIMSHRPLSAFIPESMGGMAVSAEQGLKMLEVSSYQSLALALMMGINGALFLQPVARYANADVRRRVFDKFLNGSAMGGLMITEPDFGSDALRMQTQYNETDNGYKVKGTKHWGGLTGRADYWLLTARKQTKSGDLARDIDFFVYEHDQKGIQVDEYYRNLGLYMIPYGRNKIDTVIPHDNKLVPESSGIKMMLDLLHRSRTQFPGMAMGYLKRLTDEALEHCKTRLVGGQSLFNYDQVKKRLSKMQASFTICSAMCFYSGERAALENNLADDDIPANSIKTIITDMMQDAAQSLLQLVGAKGYSLDHIAGRSLVDSRPFQIFEGSNDILYQQISESILKNMRKMKIANLKEYLSQYEFTTKVSDYFGDTFDFNVDMKMAQHKMVLLGKALGQAVSLQFVHNLGEHGFNREMIANASNSLIEDISALVNKYTSRTDLFVLDDYSENSDWASFLNYKFA